MLRKLKRITTPRKNFKVDQTYKLLQISQASRFQKYVFNKNKASRIFFGDDLFCNMLLTKEKILVDNIEHKTKEIMISYYPNYVPLFDTKELVTKSEFYWIANTMRFPCVRCQKLTISFLDDNNLKNVLCGDCISKHHLTTHEIPRFTTRTNNEDYGKNRLQYYEVVKEHQRRLFNKLMIRERKRFTVGNDIPSAKKRHYYNRVTKLNAIFQNLKGSS